MPISSNATFIPTTDEFLAHWAPVNTALAPTPLVLKGNITLAGLQALRATLVANQADVQAQRNEVQWARNAMTIIRTVLLEALGKFNGIVDGHYTGTIYEDSRPKVPGIGVKLQEFTDPMQDARTLWARLESVAMPSGLTPPLTLPVPVPAILTQAASATVNLAIFTNLLTLTQTAHASIKVAEQTLHLARKARDATQKIIYEVLKNYRILAPTRLLNTSILLETMPKLTPDDGHTPDAVNASAVFTAPDKAHIVFAESTDADLDHYELHAVIGADWDTDDAEVIATLPAGASPREFLTDFGLNQPGAAATFSVYVFLKTGNIKGSAPMTITRPA